MTTRIPPFELILCLLAHGGLPWQLPLLTHALGGTSLSGPRYRSVARSDFSFFFFLSFIQFSSCCRPVFLFFSSSFSSIRPCNNLSTLSIIAVSQRHQLPSPNNHVGIWLRWLLIWTLHFFMHAYDICKCKSVTSHSKRECWIETNTLKPSDDFSHLQLSSTKGLNSL